MNSAPFVFSNHSFTPAMTLDSSGNLGLGVTSSASINPSITIGTETLTVEMLKALKHINGFIEYAAKTDSAFGDLWTAYNTAEKLD